MVVGGDRKSSEKRSEKIGDLGPLVVEVVVVIDGNTGAEDRTGELWT